MSRLSISILLFLSFLCSCNKKEPQCYIAVPCSHTTIIPIFTGYDSTELDSIICYTYQDDTTFSTLISQQTFANPDSIQNVSFVYSPIAYFKYGFDSLILQAGFDYKIFIPHTNQTFKISHIIDTTNQTEIFDCGRNWTCHTHITNITITGGNDSQQTVQVTPDFYIFLEKQ